MKNICKISEYHRGGYEKYYLLDITPCNSLKVNWRFGGTYGLHLQGRRISSARSQRESRRQIVQLTNRNFGLVRSVVVWQPKAVSFCPTDEPMGIEVRYSISLFPKLRLADCSACHLPSRYLSRHILRLWRWRRRSFETSVDFQQTTRRYIPENLYIYNLCDWCIVWYWYTI
jgi:hypothetical protein